MIKTGCTEKRTLKVDLGDLNAFAAVARAKGFREGARSSRFSNNGDKASRVRSSITPVAASRPRR